MITNYDNKMQTTQLKFAKSSTAVQEVIKQRYREYEATAAKLNVKPVTWRKWLDKEGY